MTIMLIDDDADDREFFILAIESLDRQITCLTAAEPLQAISNLKQADTLPQIIFMDMRMPGLSGPESVKRLRQDPRFDKVPMVLYSTSDPDYGYSQAKLSGADHFFTKPPSIPQLAEILKEVLNKFRGTTA